MEAKVDEMKDLVLLNDEFKKESLMDKLKEIEDLGRELDVGGQTSYQNTNFVLNETEFPTGTSGKSRQAIFESCVRVDSLKGLVFDYHKTVGEIKIQRAKMLRAEEKLKNADNKADKIEAEGEFEIARAELRQKELFIDGMKYKSEYLLRSINDFYQNYEKNEVECKKLGFTVHDWNKMEVEDHYWRTVNDRKVIKHEMYRLAQLSKETGDSLPLQNQMDLGRIKAIGNTLNQEIQQMTNKGISQIGNDSENKDIVNWTINVGGKLINAPDDCPYKREKECTFRKEITGLCEYRYCLSLGHVVQ